MPPHPAPEPSARSLVTVPADDLAAVRTGLAAALHGTGPAVAPLPAAGAERDRVVAMCRPEQALEVPAAAVVATSGSTGAPKGVLLSAGAIIAGADATHRVLGGPGTWHLAVPAHYVAGLMVIARAVLAGTEVVPVADRLTGLMARPGERNYLSLVPTQLRRARHERALVEALAGFDAVLIGGAALDEEERTWWRDAGVRIVITYGMSETSGGCVYDGRPLPGVRVELADDGRVSIGGDVVFSGYRLRPDLTAEVLTGTGDRRTLLTRDRARWDGDRLQVLGRIDDVVISGGVNVDLAEVEHTARQVFTGREVAALGVPDAEWGTVVALAGPELPELAEVRERLAAGLGRAALPRLVIRTALPLTAGGKIDRREIVRRWAATSGGEQL